MNIYHVLTAVFIVLKLLGYFPYSWWIVFSPVIVLVAMLIVLFVLKAIAE